MEKNTTTKRQFTGKVVSDKMSKTVTVKVDRTVLHPKYHKRYTRSTKMKAHDEKGEYHMGDVVVIEECKPLSRDKRWRVIARVTKGI
jgi:small subunit ribosomal protein S17